MKHIYIYCSIIVLSITSCLQDIEHGPAIHVSVPYWADTVKEDVRVPIEITVRPQTTAISRIVVFVDNVQKLDSMVNITEAHSFVWYASFFAQPGKRTIHVKCIDAHDLYAQKTQYIQVQSLLAPRILFDSAFVYSDTIAAKNQSLHFNILCNQGERPLDSLYVMYNKTILYSYPNALYPSMNAVLQEVPFVFVSDSIGQFSLQFKLIDVAKKSSTVTRKIRIQ